MNSDWLTQQTWKTFFCWEGKVRKIVCEKMEDDKDVRMVQVINGAGEFMFVLQILQWRARN